MNHCEVIDVDGEPVRVQVIKALTPAEREALAELVRYFRGRHLELPPDVTEYGRPVARILRTPTPTPRPGGPDVSVTAKVVVSKHDVIQEGTQYEAVSLAFAADYADGRNKEWAVATPSISLMMTVKPDVARHFPMGKHITLTFDEDEG